MIFLQQRNSQKQESRMGKIMKMIYANSQCASIYFQMFDMSNNNMMLHDSIENGDFRNIKIECEGTNDKNK